MTETAHIADLSCRTVREYERLIGWYESLPFWRRIWIRARGYDLSAAPSYPEYRAVVAAHGAALREFMASHGR